MWVLKEEAYQDSKLEIVKILEAMLSCEKFEFENPSVFDQALQRTKQEKAVFSDYLIGAIALLKGYKCMIQPASL